MSDATESTPMPVIFIGHGNPMNAIEDTPWSRAWRVLGAALPPPRAILCVSAHWYVSGTWVTTAETPRTIHDFGGFPRRLYEVQYPARGAPDVARRVLALLSDHRAEGRTDWGLDHGAWSVLAHLRPAADVPVLQLSVHLDLPAAKHLELGRALAPLRGEGVLILGSGNVTHNLRHAMTAGHEPTPSWATAFDADVARACEQRDAAFLGRALDNDAGRLAHPTPDHYLPLLYAVGASTVDDAVTYPVTGFELGSLSMRAVRLG